MAWGPFTGLHATSQTALLTAAPTPPSWPRSSPSPTARLPARWSPCPTRTPRSILCSVFINHKKALTPNPAPNLKVIPRPHRETAQFLLRAGPPHGAAPMASALPLSAGTLVQPQGRLPCRSLCLDSSPTSSNGRCLLCFRCHHKCHPPSRNRQHRDLSGGRPQSRRQGWGAAGRSTLDWVMCAPLEFGTMCTFK